MNIFGVLNGAAVYAAARRVEKMTDIEDMYASSKLSDPSVIANVIIKAVTARKPKTRYAAGYMSRTVLFLRRWLSHRLFDRMIRSMV